MTTHELTDLLLRFGDMSVVFRAYNGVYHTPTEDVNIAPGNTVVIDLRSADQALEEQMRAHFG